MDTKKIEQLTEDVIKVANRYIDEGMGTEDVYGGLCGAGFLIVKASRPAEAVSGKSAVEDNLDMN